jgi:hypothetical protein
LLSKAKKKLPRIAEEKRILKEKEMKERAAEICKIKTKDILFKFDNVVFTNSKC